MKISKAGSAWSLVRREEYKHTLTKDVAMKRMCEPEEVADLMAFLSGGRADYITGVTVTIAGGKTLI